MSSIHRPAVFDLDGETKRRRSTGRPSVDGKFLRVDGQRFWIKGVTYGTFLPNSSGDLLPEPEMVRRDLQAMAEAGVNTVRTYTAPPVWFMDMAAEQGLMVVAGLFWDGYQCLFEDEDAIRRIEGSVAAEVAPLAGHPALLMISLGNEIPPLIARWHGKKAVESVLRRLRDTVKRIDPDALVTYANYPPTEHLDLSFLDVLGFNVYLEREADFRAYLARLQMLAGDRPLFVSELGLDSRRNGLEQQAETLDWQLRAVWDKGLAGATVYAWTDEWAVRDTDMHDWDFGVVDRGRHPKPALEILSSHYEQMHYGKRERWPMVSVICCAYNAASTIGETLESLERLSYPNYEIIVVDDGSRDATADIADRYRCRLLRMGNGGLSRARNIGVGAASGEIVAFIDSDAMADPDWLFFIVSQMEDLNAAASGGPNLSPPSDPETSQQVSRSPGNPVHVLLDNERAEHVPGCNMAFRKEALEEIGGFDPIYHAAGDDVDVCWKLLERGQTIAFSPAAIVWHHRRQTTAAYVRQQRGYGEAEAMLEARYPERYGMFGGAYWSGRVYEGPQPAGPFVALGARERVYHGPQGWGLFQSVYTPHAPWWISLLVAPEFHAVTLSLAASAVLLSASGSTVWPVYSALAAACLLVSLGVCLESGVRMCARDEMSGADRWRRVLGVAWLHLVQPWARWWGRMRAAMQPNETPAWPKPGGRLWARWDLRDEWLASLEQRLREAGAAVEPDAGWGQDDLLVRIAPGYTARLRSAVEIIDHPNAQIRFAARVRALWQVRLWQVTLVLALLTLLAAPALLPLAFPFGYALQRLWKEKNRLGAAIALLGHKAGESIGLVPLVDKAAEPEDVLGQMNRPSLLRKTQDAEA